MNDQFEHLHSIIPFGEIRDELERAEKKFPPPSVEARRAKQ